MKRETRNMKGRTVNGERHSAGFLHAFTFHIVTHWVRRDVTKLASHVLACLVLLAASVAATAQEVAPDVLVRNTTEDIVAAIRKDKVPSTAERVIAAV